MAYIIATTDGSKFYTGRAGNGWLSSKKTEAFIYASEREAIRKADHFSAYSGVHGYMFKVEKA